MNNYSYDAIMLYNARRSPSTVHSSNTALYNYYQRRLFNKVLSVFKFEGLPETWAENYFEQCLFGIGFLAVFDAGIYGVIPQHGTLGGEWNVFYQPRKIIVANPVLRDVHDLEIGRDCELLQISPDYTGVLDIVSFYADMMALSAEAAALNLVNSKLAYVFRVQNKAQAESFKKMFDQINAGNPAVVIDKDLMQDDGSESWSTFTQNLSQNYIAGNILDDMKTWEDKFNTEIGIPNSNTQKKERLITDEVNSNNADTYARSDLWLAWIRSGLDRVNKRYGLNISVDYRQKPLTEAQNAPQEVSDDLTIY